MTSLRIGAWNPNVLVPIKKELKVLLQANKLDIMLICESKEGPVDAIYCKILQ